MYYVPVVCVNCDHEEFAYGNLDYTNTKCPCCGEEMIIIKDDYVMDYMNPSRQKINNSLED